MKFRVEAVPISAASRRRTGKAKVEIIDTAADKRFMNALSPQAVEEIYEKIHNAKVVDVRMIKESGEVHD